MSEFGTKLYKRRSRGRSITIPKCSNCYVPRYNVDRPIYDVTQLEEEFVNNDTESSTTEVVKSIIRRATKSLCYRRCALDFISSKLPFAQIIKQNYDKSSVIFDIIAGLTIFTLHIPQGLAFGLLTGLPPVHGLYSSLFPVLAYFFFGTCRHLSIGTGSIMSLMIAIPVERLTQNFVIASAAYVENMTLANGSTTPSSVVASGAIYVTSEEFHSTRLQIAMTTTFLGGCTLVALGVLHLGIIVNYLSDPLVSGFTTAAAVQVFVTKVTSCFGFHTRSFHGMGKSFVMIYDVLINLGQTHWPTLIISIVTAIIVLIIKVVVNPRLQARSKFFVPIELILVMLATTISHFMKAETTMGINTVGRVPSGIPSPSLPDIPRYGSEVLADAIGMAIVGYATAMSLAKLVSREYSYKVYYNQELFAMGFSNMFGSLFQSYFVSAALARTLIAANVGMKTQIAALFSCGAMVIVLIWIGPFFQATPLCVLSAIILVNLKGLLLQFTILPTLWKLSIYDFMVWIITFFAVSLLDNIYGLIIGMLCTVAFAIIRSQKPNPKVLGALPGTNIYQDIRIYPAAEKLLPSILVFRFDSDVYFANAELFQQYLYQESGFDPSFDKNTCDLQVVVLDCSPWNYIDAVGIRVLGDILTSFHKVGVSVYFGCCKRIVRDMFIHSGLFDNNHRDQFYVTLHDAVLSAKNDRKNLKTVSTIF